MTSTNTKINNGGFQLEFVSISRVINHMTSFQFSALIGWNYSIKSTKFKTGHVIYNSAYTYKFQLKTTKVDYKIKIMYLGLPITEAQRAYAGMSLAGWFTISISLIQFRNRGSFSISTRKENMITYQYMYLHIGSLTKYRLLKKFSWTSY